ncbi:hypothetical protein D5086_008149 [Populus alba]|uniref:Uncharacterized protein n=1 Tax=Populus alba TaxID=43335 RepID=A0ACC4CFY9_POPAL
MTRVVDSLYCVLKMLCKGIEEDFEQEVNIIKLEMGVDEHALHRERHFFSPFKYTNLEVTGCISLNEFHHGDIHRLLNVPTSVNLVSILVSVYRPQLEFFKLQSKWNSINGKLQGNNNTTRFASCSLLLGFFPYLTISFLHNCLALLLRQATLIMALLHHLI